MKVIIHVLISILTISCTSYSQPISEDLNAKVGWMHGNCLAIKNQNVSPQYSFALVHLDDDKTIEQATIINKATTGEECYPLLEDRIDINKDSGYHFYLVKTKKPVNLAIGVLEFGDITGFDFAFCNTSEGIRFSLSKSKSSIWEGYYYLGYDSEPTCSDKSND